LRTQRQRNDAPSVTVRSYNFHTGSHCDSPSITAFHSVGGTFLVRFLLCFLINGYVYFGIGAAEIFLKTLDGVFPKVSQLLEPADGTTYLNLHPTDVQFILDRMEKLPGMKDSESPLYFHINKAIRARAHDIAHKTGIALELSHSRFTGEPVDVAINRHFLKNTFGCCGTCPFYESSAKTTKRRE